jgi:hypothetical protein
MSARRFPRPPHQRELALGLEGFVMTGRLRIRSSQYSHSYYNWLRNNVSSMLRSGVR